MNGLLKKNEGYKSINSSQTTVIDNKKINSNKTGKNQK